MQKYELYSIYDVKAKAYGSPFLAINSDLAVRCFMDLLRSPGESAWSSYPQDFALYHIGTFDNGTARLDSSQPQLIALGASLVPGANAPGVPISTTTPLVEANTSFNDSFNGSPEVCSRDKQEPQAQPDRGPGGLPAKVSPGWRERIKSVFCVSSKGGE